MNWSLLIGGMAVILSLIGNKVWVSGAAQSSVFPWENQPTTKHKKPFRVSGDI